MKKHGNQSYDTASVKCSTIGCDERAIHIGRNGAELCKKCFHKEWLETSSGYKFGETVTLLGKDCIVTNIVSYGDEWLLHLDNNPVGISINTTGLEHKKPLFSDGRKIVERGDGWYIIEWPNGRRVRRSYRKNQTPTNMNKTQEINFWADRGGRM